MKKVFILVVCCLILFAGCSGQRPVSPNNNNNIQNSAGQSESTRDDSPDKAPDTGANTTAPSHATLPPGASDTDIIEIKEKLFVAQTNDVYYNAEDYLGKTIKYEGIFVSFYEEASNVNYHYVIRYGPGCCGFDSNAGFEVVWSGDYPEENDWVEAVGVLEEYEEGEYKYLRLNLSSLTVLDTRGEEYVYQ